MLDPRKLGVLEAIGELGSFSAAADALNYTQSAVSQHVAALERAVGMTLVDRGQRPVRLTAVGVQLVEDARPALQHLRRAERRLREIIELRAGLVRLGASPAAQVGLIPRALVTFRARHPAVDVELNEAEPPLLIDHLRSGTIDLAIVYTVPGSDHPFKPPITLRALGDDPLVVVLAATHRMARRRAVRLADLAGERWIVAPRDYDFRTLFDRLCSEAGFDPQVAIETANPHAGVALAAAGFGTMLVPSLVVRGAGDATVVAVRDIPAARSVWIATISGRHHPAVTALSDALANAQHAASQS
ncbi:MAG: hypothetical protein QOJ63_2236 [Solirubrobacteraceae bacterium]|jgi:DNA-binding transcriptional LysR family regulator|nr:hypothetical protein [Solirubrobacteraceae bacterium]